MKTRNTLRHLPGYLALVCGLVIGTALAQGSTPQTLTWTGTTNEILTLNVASPLGATASSGLPVTLRVDNGPGVLADGKILVSAFGTVVVTAEQPGDATYAAARLTRSFNVRHALLSPVGRLETGSDASAVQLVGNYAYVAANESGLQVFDVRSPALSIRVGGVVTAQARAVQVVGNYAYVADGAAGLQVIDVSNPASPVRMGGFDTSGSAEGVQVVGNYAYVADRIAGLQVIDVSNPASLVRTGGFNTSGDGLGVQVVGNYAYVADGASGLQVIEVSNPANPVWVGGYKIGGAANAAFGVQVVGNYAYVAYGYAGLRVVDVSNPANPLPVGKFDMSGIASGVQVVGDYAYVVEQSSGVQVIDVSNRSNPVRVGGVETVLDAYDLQIVGNYAYVAGGADGLRIFEHRLGYPQILTWTGTTNEILTLNVAHPLGATASSGLPVTLRVDAGPAVLADGKIAVSSFGTVVVTAEQAGDATYLPARETHSFNVRQALLKPTGAVAVAASGYIRDVEVVGNHAYVVAGEAGLEVIDVSNPANPKRVSELALSDPQGLAVVGHHAYVVDTIDGLQVIDVSNPATPIRVGGIGVDWIDLFEPRAVAVVGNHAYVADGESGLQVIDVSNPARPVRVGGFDTSEPAFGVQVVGHYAYVATQNSRFQVIDVSNPASPVRVGVERAWGSDLAVVGNFAYLAAGEDGLQVVDVSNPANPIRVGRSDYWASGVHVVGPYAYVAGVFPWLRVADVSNPANPVWVGSIETSGYATAVQMVGNLAYVGAGNELQIFEVRMGYSQTLAWTENPPDFLPPNVGHALGAKAGSGLPATLRVESGPAVLTDGTLTVTGVGNIWVTAEQPGDEVYLPAPELALSFNVRRAALTRVGGNDTSGNANGVQVVGNHAYLADGNAGLQVIDVSNPANPVRTGGFNTSGFANGVQVVGNYAYVADSSAGLQVIDVSDPANPVRVGGYKTSFKGNVYNVQVVGNYAYVADGAGLEVLDVNNPASPVRVGGYGNGVEARGVQVMGNYAYVAGNYAGVQVIDVSNPATPVRVSHIEAGYGGTACGVHVVGNHAYVADGSLGLQVIDVSNPAKPVRVGGYDTIGNAVAVQVVGNYAYVAAGESGWQIIDVSNPARPVRVGWFDSSGYVYGFQVVGNLAYVADGPTGLQILELRTGFLQALSLRLPEKTPFVGSPVVSAVTADSGLPVTLSVVSGPATVVNQQLLLSGPGRITLRAEQAGTADFLPVSAQWTLIITLPRLGVRLADGQVEVFWAAGLAGLQLQGRASLAPDSSWQGVTTPPAEAGGEARVRSAEAALLRYFRLVMP